MGSPADIKHLYLLDTQQVIPLEVLIFLLIPHFNYSPKFVVKEIIYTILYIRHAIPKKSVFGHSLMGRFFVSALVLWYVPLAVEFFVYSTHGRHYSCMGSVMA